MAKDNEGSKKLPGLIGVQEAAVYLDCSAQELGARLNSNTDALNMYFRYYGGRFRTTYHLLDLFFTLNGVRADAELKKNQPFEEWGRIE